MKVKQRFVLLLFACILMFISSCERDTVIMVDINSPISFRFNGSGNLNMLSVGEITKPHNARILKWEIVQKDHEVSIEALSPIIYGQVPKGYIQTYPKDNKAEELKGGLYVVWVNTIGANGTSKKFTISN